jgi:two-component system cell cycle response regulator CpdR
LEAQHFIPAPGHRHAGDGRDRACPESSAIDPAIRVMFITGFAAVALQGGRTAPEASSLQALPSQDLVMEVDRMFQTEDQHG